MEQHLPSISIGILNYPGAQLAAVHGLTDMLLTANKLAKQYKTGSPEFAASHWEFDQERENLHKSFASHETMVEPLVALIIPPSLDIDPDAQMPRPLLCRF